ncbi:TPA: DUF551 domain-containing protein [Pseudomonas aeruginosa]
MMLGLLFQFDQSNQPPNRALANTHTGGKMSEWKTIDSAPKDGTKFLGYCPDYGVRETHMRKYTEGSIGYATWQRGDGPLNAGWDWFDTIHSSILNWRPTHWMPLPAPPAD